MPKIQIVEDGKNTITVLKMLFEKKGYQIKVNNEGISAVETANQWEPDLIILDLKLPKMNGYLVMEALKDNPETEGIPILVFSAKSEDKQIKRAYDKGADDYIVKPIDHEAFLNKVDDLLENSETTNGNKKER